MERHGLFIGQTVVNLGNAEMLIGKSECDVGANAKRPLSLEADRLVVSTNVLQQ